MLVTLLTTVEVAYVLALAVWIILEKRSPLATVAWILVLAALPLVGFVLYYFIGPRRLRKRRSKRASIQRLVRAAFEDTNPLFEHPGQLVREQDDPRRRQLMALALNNNEAPITGGNELTALRNGTETYKALEEAIRGAQHHVHFQYYIFNADPTGARFRDLLAERAKAGVKVRLLVDAVGSGDLDDAFLEPLVAAGGEVGFFNPVSFARFRPRWNLRNHRKIAVVDGTTGFLGGLNIGDEYASLSREFGPWRDTHLRVRGPAVRSLQLLFLEDWNFATNKSLSDPAYFRPVDPAGTQVAQIVGSGPDRDWEAIQQAFFAAITGARERVCITTPYFVPDDALQTAISTAALRGVDVKVLVPKRLDTRVVLAAGRSYWDDFLRAGVRIYEYLPGALHAKTLCVDGEICIVGTANLDARSFRLNFEVDCLAYDPSLTRELEGLFEQDLTLAREVTLESRSELTLTDRLAEASARLLAPML